jgi:hypothetical protein
MGVLLEDVRIRLQLRHQCFGMEWAATGQDQWVNAGCQAPAGDLVADTGLSKTARSLSDVDIGRLGVGNGVPISMIAAPATGHYAPVSGCLQARK